MNKVKYSRLSLMMFLEYAVWGAWLPVAGAYLLNGLGFSGAQMGTILGLGGAVGALFAPFIAGQLADRYFSTERFLAFLFMAGGIVKWITADQTSYQAWLWLSIIYSVLYMPTIALTNSLAFAHLDNQEKEFPYVRVWGTIGWIAASWIFPWIWIQKDLHFTALPPFLVGTDKENAVMLLKYALKFSAMLSFGLGLYSLTLPHTPPKKDATEKLAFAKAFGLFKYSSFTTLVIASLLISVVHTIYFFHTGPFLTDIGLDTGKIGPAMSIGQFAEILVLAPLGFMLAKFKMKRVIFLGCMAYVARYAIFGTTSLPLEVIVASQFLHGFCFACFYAAAFIYIDALADDDIRNSIQTVFGIILLGLGPILAGTTYGLILGSSTTEYTFAGAQSALLSELEEGKTRTLVLHAQQKKLAGSYHSLIEGDAKSRAEATGEMKLQLETEYQARKTALGAPLEAMQAAAAALEAEDTTTALANQKAAHEALKSAAPAMNANEAWKESNKFARIDYGKFWYTLAAIGFVAGLIILVSFSDQTASKTADGKDEDVSTDVDSQEPEEAPE